MHRTVGFHTLEDRKNPDYIKKFAPFACTRSDAWLSYGYYFWERDLLRAHAWGKQAYGDNKYVICECLLELPNMLDLVGNREHQDKMRELVTYLAKTHPALQGVEPPLSKAIALLRLWQKKRRIANFPYDSVRAQDFPNPATYKFVEKENRRVETTILNPRIQICLFTADKLALPSLKIIYPEPYT